MKKVLIIVGDASETLDTLYPYHCLQESGIEPVVAAPCALPANANGKTWA
ncbi:MAG: hypothetical protein OSB39_14510 [Opitutales bacterium]|nr:hypothetical protein [Opitutales bacterium]